MSRITIPAVIPICMQDIDVMRCVTCGEVLPGSWGLSRSMNLVGIDHLLERHPDLLTPERVPRPPFIDCTVQDPFWFDEHAPEKP